MNEPTKPLRIVVTGSRRFQCSDDEMDRIMLRAIRAVLAQRYAHGSTLRGIAVHLGEGGANGADTMARAWAIRREKQGVSYSTYHADWDTHGDGAGPIRNGRMLREHSPELVLAIWNGSTVRSGTHNCIAQAAKLRIPVLIHPI